MAQAVGAGLWHMNAAFFNRERLEPGLRSFIQRVRQEQRVHLRQQVRSEVGQ